MRTRWGQLVAPLPLRLVLGMTFLWAGLGKIEGEFLVQGDTAATLASMGVDRLREEGQRNLRATPAAANQPSQATANQATTNQPTTNQPAPNQPNPTSDQPQPMGPPLPELLPGDGAPAPTNPGPINPGPINPGPAPDVPTPLQPSGEQREGQPVLPTLQPTEPALPRASRESWALAMPVLAQVTAPPATPDPSTMSSKGEVVYHAGLFSQPVSIKRLYRISLIIYRAGNPAVPAAASPIASPNSSPVALSPSPARKLLPSFVTKGSRPVALAWMLAIGEVIIGVLLLIGLLTRISATWCACVMLGAIWLTELGPAIQSSSTMLGFLPKRDMWDVELWKSLLWQCSLLAGSLALAFMGSGWLGLDKRLFPDAPPTPSRPRPMM